MHYENLASEIATEYSTIPETEAVALSGSLGSGSDDDKSDMDVYVYTKSVIPLESRKALILRRADHYELNNQFWETGDEWKERSAGISVDVMYRNISWIEDQLDAALVRHQPSIGYSTCIWYNVQSSRILFDRNGWFEKLQAKARQPYPEELRRAIVRKNHPLLRSNISSYREQLRKAVERKDLVSVNHRVAALFAGYFDILFAVNRLLHPGEKRLAQFASRNCSLKPDNMDDTLEAVLRSLTQEGKLLQHVDLLIGNLDALLLSQGLIDPGNG